MDNDKWGKLLRDIKDHSDCIELYRAETRLKLIKGDIPYGDAVEYLKTLDVDYAILAVTSKMVNEAIKAEQK